MIVRPEDLGDLVGHGGRAFEEFLYDLVVAEASRHGIPLGAVRWDYRTNVGDGGRDIILDAVHTDPIRFIPQGQSIWSAKSGADGTQPSKLKQELIDPGHTELRKHLQAGKRYVWCTLQPMSEDAVSALRAQAEEIAKDPSYNFDPKFIEFCGVTTLCSTLKDNPGLIPKHLPNLSRAFEGVFSLNEWEAQDQLGFAAPFVNFGGRSDVVAQIQSHLRARTGPNVLHLAGLSGIGKTRTVLEACREQRDLTGVLYIPQRPNLREPLLRHLTRNTSLLALVVVDEVPLEDLRTLTSQVEHFSERLRFVTIGPARRNERGRSSANILILQEPETRHGVLEVIRSINTGFSEPVLESIAHFAAHDLRLALMLVEATRQDGEFHDLPIEDGEDVWRRVTSLFGPRLGDINVFRTHYPYLTFAIDIGFRGELRYELEQVSKQFEVASQRLYEAIACAVPCGLGLMSTDFFEPSPRALAGHLFRQRVWASVQPRLATFLGGLSDRLLRRFVERCQECAGPERQEMEEALASFFWRELGQPDVTRLADRVRSRLFKAWAELDPTRGMNWLCQAADLASDAQLAALTGDSDGSGGWRGRRQIVWLCESLASFGEHFWGCEAVLFRLAQVETETSIGNNSQSIWKSMFHPVFAFTEIPFPDRANHLLIRLQAANERTFELIISAIHEALVGSSVSRMVPPAVVGGRVIPEPWKPATHAELYKMQQALGQQVLEVINLLPSLLRSLGPPAIVSNLGAFIRLGLVRELRELLDDQDEDLRRALRLELRQIIQDWDRRGHNKPPLLQDLYDWDAELRPKDLVGMVQELTSLEYWDAMRATRTKGAAPAPSPYVQLAAEILVEPNVFRQLDHWFRSGEARSSFHLAAAIGEIDQDELLAPTITCWLDEGHCREVVAGYLYGLHRREGALPAAWSQRLDKVAPDRAEYVAIVTADADFSVSGFQRILNLVTSGALQPRILNTFQSPNWEPYIGETERSNLLELLVNLSMEGQEDASRVALTLGESWTNFGEGQLQPELAAPVIQLLRSCLNIRCDPGAWASLLKSLRATHPQEFADLALDGLTSSGSQRVMLQDLILPALLECAHDHPLLVMGAIGQRILDPAKRPYFGFLRFEGLFDAIGLREVQRWLCEHDSELAAYVARHLSSPSIHDGLPSIPPVTDWVLTEFNYDDRVFQEFCRGRHSFEIRTGHARDRRDELERSLESFRNHEKSWLRRWAEFELHENERDAELDDRFDDQLERM